MHPKIVQEILGHSNIAITLDIYSHRLPTMESNASGRLDDLFKEQHCRVYCCTSAV
jgi:integrase